MSKIETAGRQAYQGLTLGFGDELIDVPTAAIVAALTGQKYKDVLKEARDISKKNLAKDWEENTAISLAANIAGGVPFGLASAGKNVTLKGLGALDKLSDATKLGKYAQAITNAGKGLTSWASTGGRLARAGKGSAAGAGYGAIAGLGAGGDSIEERIISSLLGTAIGGTAGGAGGALSRGNPTAQSVAPKAAKQASGNKAEQEFLRQLLMRPDLEDMQKRMVDYQGLSKKTGIELTLPEMLAQTDVDPLLSQQAILTKSPETAGAAQSLLQRRMGDPLAGQTGQITGALKNVSNQLAPGSYDELAQGLISSGKDGAKRITSELSAKATPLYDEAFTSNSSIGSKELDRILETPAGRKAFSRAREILQNEGTRLGIPDKELGEMAREMGIKSKGGVASGLKLRTYDLIKRGLDDMISDEVSRSTPGTTSGTARSLMSLRSRLLGELDNLDVTAKAGANSLKADGGAYARARNIYSSQPEVLQNRQLMGELANIDQLSPERVVGQLYGGTVGTAQRTASALGEEGSRKAAAAKIQDIIGGLKSGSLPPRLDEDTVNMLKVYSGKDAPLVQDFLRTVERARAGERFLRGSQTQANNAMQQSMGDAATGAAIDLATGNEIGLTRRALGEISEWVGGNSKEQYNRDLLNMFTTPRGTQAVDDAVKIQQQLMKVPPSTGQIPVAATGGAAVTQATLSPEARPQLAPAYTATPAMTQMSNEQRLQKLRRLKELRDMQKGVVNNGL